MAVIWLFRMPPRQPYLGSATTFQPGQSVVLYNVLVREDRLITISKSTMFWCNEVEVPGPVDDAAPQMPTDEASSSSCCLSQAVTLPQGMRVDVKGRVAEVCTCTLI